MVRSPSTTPDYIAKATWQRGISCYGRVMIGGKGFEFYSDKDVLDYIQIPWNEITYVVADIHFKGKYIPRSELRTRNNGGFIFSAEQPVFVLKVVRKYIPADRMRQALPLWQKVKSRFK